MEASIKIKLRKTDLPILQEELRMTRILDGPKITIFCFTNTTWIAKNWEEISRMLKYRIVVVYTSEITDPEIKNTIDENQEKTKMYVQNREPIPRPFRKKGSSGIAGSSRGGSGNARSLGGESGNAGGSGGGSG